MFTLMRRPTLLRVAAPASNALRRLHLSEADVLRTSPELLVQIFNGREDMWEDMMETQMKTQAALHQSLLMTQTTQMELHQEVLRDREKMKKEAWRELAKYRLFYCTRTIFQDLSHATLPEQLGSGGQVYKHVIREVILEPGKDGKLSELSAAVYKQLTASDMFSTARNKGSPDSSWVQSLLKIYPDENENAHSRPEFQELSPFNAPGDTGLCCGGVTHGRMLKHALVLTSMQRYILNNNRTIEDYFQNIAVISPDMTRVVGYLVNGEFTDIAADVRDGEAEGNTKVDE